MQRASFRVDVFACFSSSPDPDSDQVIIHIDMSSTVWPPISHDDLIKEEEETLVCMSVSLCCDHY